jgi:hypothetical protein
MPTDPNTIPPPPSSRRRLPATEETFFEDLFLDLTLRIEWLTQVLDSVPQSEPAQAALTTLRGYAKALTDVGTALGHVQSHAKERRFAELFSLDGALAAYLSRLYAWSEEISSEFEALAVGLRKQQPVWLLSHKKVDASFAHFHALSEALRKELLRARPVASEGAAAWAPFDAHLDELLWATEWLHLSMAKPPGS